MRLARLLSSGILFAVILSLVLAYAPKAAFASGQWTLTGSMVAPHGAGPMVMLQNGKPLVISGSTQTPVSEIYDESTGQWTQTGNVNQPRDQLVPVVLNNGKVLIAGGVTHLPDIFYNTSELYDPATGQWSYTGNLNIARSCAILVKLLDGRVLAIGGFVGAWYGTTSSELYDPNTGQWTFAADAHISHCDTGDGTSSNAVLLNDGRVLVVGSTTGDSDTAEIYDPSTNQWSYTGNLALARSSAHLIKLQDGRVLMAGGADYIYGTYISESEIYDPASNQWTQTGSLNYGRYGHDLVLLSDGRVLTAGGLNRPNGVLQEILPSEIYDPSTGIWTVDASLNVGHNVGSMIVLPDGKILMAAGYSNTNSVATTVAELYMQAATDASPTINPLANVTINQGDTYSANGSFTDADSSSWTATVDYGDGSGVQSLPLSGTTFSLSHIYGAVGTYTVTVNVTDNQGATGTATATVTVQRQLTSLAQAKVWIGLKNSDDVGVKFDLLAEVYVNGVLLTSGQLNSVAGGSSGFNNAHLQSIAFNTFAPVNFPAGSTLSIKLYVRNTCSGSTHNSGTARLWFNDSAANSQFGATIGGSSQTYYLLSGFTLGTSAGVGPKATIDVAAGSPCSAFKAFGTWTITP